MLHIPARELTMAGMEGMSRQYEQARIAALSQLADAPLVTLSAAALVQKTMPPDTLRASTLTLRPGDLTPLADLTARLVTAGYQRCAQVEGPGQFSVRGGILDVFPPRADAPVRIEFWGDEIDSMAAFDVGSQRRGASLDAPGLPALHGNPAGLRARWGSPACARRWRRPGTAAAKSSTQTSCAI